MVLFYPVQLIILAFKVEQINMSTGMVKLMRRLMIDYPLGTSGSVTNVSALRNKFCAWLAIWEPQVLHCMRCIWETFRFMHMCLSLINMKSESRAKLEWYFKLHLDISVTAAGKSSLKVPLPQEDLKPNFIWKLNLYHSDVSQGSSIGFGWSTVTTWHRA